MSQEPIHATTLDDLSDVYVVATIPRPDGRRIDVSMRTLSSEEVWSIRRAIKWPKPPIRDFARVGGAVTPHYDYENEDYRNALDDANRELAFGILFASVQIETPGETVEERRAEFKRRLGQWAFNHLLEKSNQIHIPQASEVAEIAASFRPDGASGAPGDDGAQPDAEALA